MNATWYKMKDLNFNDEQIKTILLKKAKEIGFNEMLKFTFETIMMEETDEYKKDKSDVSNGFRYRNFLSNGQVIEPSSICIK